MKSKRGLVLIQISRIISVGFEDGGSFFLDTRSPNSFAGKVLADVLHTGEIVAIKTETNLRSELLAAAFASRLTSFESNRRCTATGTQFAEARLPGCADACLELCHTAHHHWPAPQCETFIFQSPTPEPTTIHLLYLVC